MFEKFNSLLDSLLGFDNYWSEVGQSDATALLDQFAEEDWRALRASLSLKSDEWQVYCAEALCDASSPQVPQVLLQLVREATHEDAVVAALDSLRSLPAGRIDLPAMAAELRGAIDALRPTAGAAVAGILDDFKKRLG